MVTARIDDEHTWHIGRKHRKCKKGQWVQGEKPKEETKEVKP